MRKIKTRKQALREGYEINRGSYVGTTDNRIDRWYIERTDSTAVDRRGAGYATLADAIARINELQEMPDNE